MVKFIMERSNLRHQRVMLFQLMNYSIPVAKFPELYCYPNWTDPTTVFDFEDLQEDSLLVLCVRAQIGEPGHEHDQHKVYVWKGHEFDEEEANNEVINVSDFVNKAMEDYWGCKNPGD